MKKIITFIHGFCMALADSVPGVSGGTVAFLLGFYDRFVDSLDDLISGTKEKRIAALRYLIKLGIGWGIGFLSAVLVLANVFESHIYLISSLFMGFILFAIPVVILEEKQLPIMNCAYTQCFRREAGSYGKDVRGLNRLHEFSKVELVRIDKPEHSKESHQQMLDHVEGLLQKLELPYRILRLCGGDMSFTAALCFDFEVYSEAQKRWLEVSSVSNFDTYQANRLKCRYRSAEKKTELCHTLNGSALALPRIVAALLENNQTPEGIRIPKALVPYCGFEMID